MKRYMLLLGIVTSLVACNGAGDRTHEMNTVTDSTSNQVQPDTTATTNNDAYKNRNSNSGGSGSSGLSTTNATDSALDHVHPKQEKNK